MGLSRAVSRYESTIENTIQERILTLQNSKRALAIAILGEGRTKNLKLSLEVLMVCSGLEERTTKTCT